MTLENTNDRIRLVASNGRDADAATEKMSATGLYNELAWTWEILVSEEDFNSEADFVREMAEKFGRSEGNSLLDLGCGAGHHDLLLKEDFQVVGVDGSEEMLKLAHKDVIVMHPGPLNRGVEISSEVADSACSVVLNQVTNGVAVRMALLYLLIGGSQA